MVATEGDDAGEGSSLDRGAPFVGVGCGGAGEDLKVAFLDLFKCVCVVISWCLSVSSSARTAGVLRGNGDIAAVENSGPAVEGVRFKGDVVASASILVNIHSIGRV